MSTIYIYISLIWTRNNRTIGFKTFLKLLDLISKLYLWKYWKFQTRMGTSCYWKPFFVWFVLGHWNLLHFIHLIWSILVFEYFDLCFFSTRLIFVITDYQKIKRFYNFHTFSICSNSVFVSILSIISFLFVFVSFTYLFKILLWWIHKLMANSDILEI